MLVRFNDFFDADALVFSFLDCFTVFNVFMVIEVFQVFGMNVGFVGLRFRR